MVKVYPKIELQTNYIFSDSKGQRQQLQPAETMDDVGKTPQEFDGEDPIVAAVIMEQLDAKTVTASKGDRKILDATLAAAATAEEPEPKAAKKATKKEIATAVNEATIEATSVANNANKEAMDDLVAGHDKIVEELKAKLDETKAAK